MILGGRNENEIWENLFSFALRLGQHPEEERSALFCFVLLSRHFAAPKQGFGEDTELAWLWTPTPPSAQAKAGAFSKLGLSQPTVIKSKAGGCSEWQACVCL